MTQESTPQQDAWDTTPTPPDAWRAPGTHAPPPGYPEHRIPAPASPPPGEHLPAQGYAGPPARGPRPLWIMIGVLAVVVVVMAGVLVRALVSPSGPATAPPASRPIAGAPPASSADSPASAADARRRLESAFARFRAAGIRFSQQARQAGTANDQQLGRAAVTEFRAAAYGYDAEIRAITFPNAEQTVVNTQLLPATGRLVADLDQIAALEPTAPGRSVGEQTKNDAQTTFQLSQQIIDGLPR